jgi:hypothetical protein
VEVELLWLGHEQRLIPKKLAVCSACTTAYITTIYGTYSKIGDRVVK